ncbi:MAG: ABC transporter permease [Gammaproteobacteria bacterium]|nr:ABC transporter permease [Gammaproteobacteria bacterium]MBU2285892.1 ABC transporter permease [Gammaproteobacteria bacterium]
MNTFVDSVVAAGRLVVSGDAVLMAIVARSLAVSACACALACTLGMVLGAWLAVARFPGRALVLTLLNTLLALPSVVVGLAMYLLLSHSGPLGFLGWLFSFKAMVLAQSVLVLPVVTALTRQAIEDADRDHGEQLRSLGAGQLARALLLVRDERYALFTVLITGFGRAVSEVGAVMIVGGNVDGFTRVMTTAIALETSKGDLPLALALGLVLLGVVLVLNIAISALRGWRERVDGGAAGTAMARHPGGAG